MNLLFKEQSEKIKAFNSSCLWIDEHYVNVLVILQAHAFYLSDFNYTRLLTKGSWKYWQQAIWNTYLWYNDAGERGNTNNTNIDVNISSCIPWLSPILEFVFARIGVRPCASEDKMVDLFTDSL